MYIPVATYRVQLYSEFSLHSLEKIADYLQKLGISTIYASPVFKSVPGSTHGYDSIDPRQLNPEIGTPEELRSLCEKFKSRHIGWMQDIVPNHMAFHTSNKLLMDVLERGDQSPFYNYFDINWSHPASDLNGKLMLPVLSGPVEEVIDSKDLQLALVNNELVLSLYDQHFPLSIPAVLFLQQLPTFSLLSEVFTTGPLSYVQKAKEIRSLEDWDAHKKHLSEIHSTDVCWAEHLRAGITAINADADFLKQVLDKNFYRLVPSQRSSSEINYRRFFTVNELICVNMELPEVFTHYHQLIAQLIRENCIQALRVDHIDGLKEPLRYLRKLRELAGNDCYIVTEKILSPNEVVPSDWPQQGTTGYDFLRIVNRLFTSNEQLKQLKAFYFNLFPNQDDFEQQVAACKQLILEKYMKGELHNLTDQLLALPGMEPGNRQEMESALGLLMVAMPCYRIYPQQFPLPEADAAILRSAFNRARELSATDINGLNRLEALFTNTDFGNEDNDKVLGFLKRMMQFTGPLTAKGVEDTAFYRYGVLLSQNEVGDHPSGESITPDEFHRQMEERMQRLPVAMNGTATHDTKRGEDARMRINCLGMVFNRWKACVDTWMRDHAQFSAKVQGTPAPTRADDYFIYQSIVGGAPPDMQLTDEWKHRFCNYFLKAVREAKLNSNWVEPDTVYEDSCTAFIMAICNHAPFIREMTALVKELDRFAHVFSLAQVVLKMTAPGIPDIYQGCERWDYSFVDPDNRRAVDYTTTIKYLDDILSKEKQNTDELLSFLRQYQHDGVTKLFTTYKTLQLRQAYKDVFTRGAYIPLTVFKASTQVIAYARRFDNTCIVIIVPLQLPQDLPSNASVQLPPGCPSIWRNIFTGREWKSDEQIPLHEVLNEFPVAIMESGII
ncbi:MAG: malto-oligosyltrehalose synthase [Agriterribacter sp.]